MESTVLERLRESLSERRQALAEWFRQAPPEARRTRTGLLGDEGIQEEIQTLDEALRKTNDKTLGICDVCHDYVDTSRLEMDYTASVCIEHLTGEEKTMLENELELSQKVQKALLPNQVPSIRGLEVAAFSQPAHIVGGDYFDFFQFRDGLHGFVIADVMGKGMPASLLMASFQASLKIIAPESTDAAEVVARLNHLFCHNIRLTKFVTVFLGRYDERSRVFEYCNAGHNPPLLRRQNGTIESMNPTGAAIGLVEQAQFQVASVVLRPEDRILFYTDGVVEARNAETEEYGQKRLEELLSARTSASAPQLIEHLKEGLRAFSGTRIPLDDTTVIAVRVMK